MRLIIFIFCTLATLAANSHANTVAIQARVDNGPWTTIEHVEVLTTQSLALRVEKQTSAAVRWFRIIPDIDQRYNNAEWPWMPNAYKWKGYAEINYTVEHLTRFDVQQKTMYHDKRRGLGSTFGRR